MSLTRRERALGHQKSSLVTVATGPPNTREGSDGDMTLRTVAKGLILYIKKDNRWYDVSSLTSSDIVWHPMVLLNNWVAYDTGAGAVHSTPAYAKDRDGFVHLRGVIMNGDSGTHNITYLPTGFRPAKHAFIITAISGGSAYAAISASNGSIILITGNTTMSSLDGITFYAGN